MRKKIENYLDIIGINKVAEIYKNAQKLQGIHILHINSTAQGGGVAEMLSSFVPLMNDVGVHTGWRVLHGTPDFFTITKKFHNALQGDTINLTEMKKSIYRQTNENFAVFTHIDHDYVIIHDPQPLPLINFYSKQQPWLLRFHIEFSKPNDLLWEYFKRFIIRYNMLIVSNENYLKKDLPIEQKVMLPAIDPLSPKNINLPYSTIKKVIKKFKIKTDKPIITQISRFDKWKDPAGVIKIFKKVREKIDCRLILCGSMATDDPEGILIYERLVKQEKKLLENGDIIFLTAENNILVNILQNVSDVIIQKSIREGFGLTVTEALWKEKPVVASNIGGIPLQIKDGKNGFLLDPMDYSGFADRIIEILRHPDLGKELGKNGKSIVRENFLITRLLNDYIKTLFLVRE